MPRSRVILVVAALLMGCGGKQTVTYETSKVDRGRIAPKVTATGTLSALVTVQVGSQVSGRVAQLMADFNSTVDAGQVIAKIDPQIFDAAMEQARANQLAAQGNLTRAIVQSNDAARQYERSKSLAERKLVAQADLDTALATYEAAKAQIDVAKGNMAQAKAAVKQAEVNLAYTTIVSPISGVVISRSVDVGQTVAASLSAPTLFVIAEDLRKMQVDTAVSESDVGKLQPGMGAVFTVDAFPSERFRGKVRQIRNAPTTVQNVVTYDAVIDVENAELKLRPGMTANVTFTWAERDDVLRVPNAALRFKPSAELLGQPAKVPVATEGAPPQGRGGPGAGAGPRQRPPNDEKTVYLLKEGSKLEPQKLKVGVTDGSVTEVLEGLDEGALVVTEANDPNAAKKPSGMGQSPMGGGGRGPRGPF